MNLVHQFAEGKPVFGVEVVGDYIYIIRESTPQIEVYDKGTFVFVRNIDINDVKGPYDMVQSRGHPNFLLIADWNNPLTITAVQLPEAIVSTWNILEDSQTTLGLARSSIFTGPDIFVTTGLGKKLKKFTPQGNLVGQVINLQNISQTRQSTQVAEDEYAVCGGYGPPPELHQVCLVNANGVVNATYGGIRGSGVGQLNTPARLEMRTKDKCILVADTGNKRVVVLNQNLQHVADLSSEGLKGPYRLYLDEEDNFLYVADNTVNDEGLATSGRVLVYQLN